MNNMKRGFTMIELIMVIVIIGVLTSVALPRLAMSKDDATVASCLHEYNQFVRELQSAYVATNDLDVWQTKKISELTNIRVGAQSSLNNGLVGGEYTVAHQRWIKYICAGEHIGWVSPRLYPATATKPANYQLILAVQKKANMTTPVQMKFYDKFIKQHGSRVKRIQL